MRMGMGMYGPMIRIWRGGNEDESEISGRGKMRLTEGWEYARMGVCEDGRIKGEVIGI